MQLVYDSKIMQNILSGVELRGKYLTSTGLKADSLGEYVKIIATNDGWRNGYYFLNGNAQTFVCHYLPALIEENEEYVIETAKLQKYLKNMSGEVTINISETNCKVSCENKRATISTAILHPHEMAIDKFFSYSKEKAIYTEDLQPLEWGKKTVLGSGVGLKSSHLSKAMSACEAVGHGIYKFNIMDGEFTITSRKDGEEYSETFEVGTIGEATVEFTGPMHKGCLSENVNIYFNDDSLVTFVTENIIIARAPYVVV